jgi:hypothetical protein
MGALAEFRELNQAIKSLSVDNPFHDEIAQRIEDLGNQPMIWSYNCIICRKPVTFTLTVGEADEWTAPPTGVCGECAR